ncbi:MAG TPA: hypothetical protein PK256_06170 [Verrucomicrobiota bacterium]|nr:hypothetical protein [Verrucomicrobiota bacterium]
MIDTVKFDELWLVQKPCASFAESKTWQSRFMETYYPGRFGGKAVPSRRWHLIHTPTGLRASGSEAAMHQFEVSLPRVLFGHNGRLLKSQKEIDTAMDQVREILDEIGEGPDEPPVFKRVDLVWQFKGDPKLFIAAHEKARHRRIRRDAVRFENGSLTWIGSSRSVVIYDKLLEMTRNQPGDVVRAEVRLRGCALKRMFGPEPIRQLSFDRCYEAYRNTMLGFCPNKVPRPSNFAESLAVAQREGWQSGGVSAFDIFCGHLGQRQRRRLQKQMAQIRGETFGFDWADLLPEGHPPAPVEITDEMLAGAVV